jgi:hypothetical protein
VEKVKKRDCKQVKADAQAIYQADNSKQAQAAGRRFCRRWQRNYPSLVRELERDLPELLSFFALPRHLWKKLRTTKIIERCFVEVRRRTRPMVCFVICCNSFSACSEKFVDALIRKSNAPFLFYFQSFGSAAGVGGLAATSALVCSA